MRKETILGTIKSCYDYIDVVMHNPICRSKVQISADDVRDLIDYFSIDNTNLNLHLPLAREFSIVDTSYQLVQFKIRCFGLSTYNSEFIALTFKKFLEHFNTDSVEPEASYQIFRDILLSYNMVKYAPDRSFLNKLRLRKIL